MVSLTKMQRLAQPQRVAKLRELLQRDGIVMMPCCFNGLTARLIERAGFDVTFMTGFGVSAAHGFPDTQLISFGEMLSSATDINAALKQIPCIGDADTGYGNAVNVKRTVTAYAQAGMAGIMLEDQVSPKRCGHTSGKAVVSRKEAYQRIQAAVDARKEGNFDIVIVARTDARGPHSLEEAIERCKEFVRIGADVTFLDAPRSIEDMREYCKQVPGPKMITLIERGPNPIASPAQLAELGYKLATYPATLLNVGIKAMEQSLELLKQQAPETQQDGSNASPDAALDAMLCDFEHVKDVVGFTEYNAEEARYSSKK